MQLDMLAYVDESGTEPLLVIGSGVPKSWIDRPMRVGGLPTSAGVVDWSWKDAKMQVAVHGRRIQVRLGRAFGPSAPVELRLDRRLNDHRLQGGGFDAKSWLRTEVLRSRFGDLKVVAPVVRFGAVLVLQVLHDDFIRHVPAACDEVPACPQVPTPELFLDVLELHHQLA